MRTIAQLATLVQFLAETRADELPAFWQRVRTMNGRIHEKSAEALTAATKTDLATLEKEWLAWGKAHDR
jgi:hypothetical protein